ncbi:MAG: hypothetical protein HYT10_00140 [Candidatus Levybacteria bacterium]|nr:hypothetical protein [Candidatus Levybacteria bacterium]
MKEDLKFTRKELLAGAAALFLPTHRYAEVTPSSKLEKFLYKIKPLYKQDKKSFGDPALDPFSELKIVAYEKRMEDLKMYDPMYIAAEKKYGVPRQLLWIIHEVETDASANPAADASGYVGAMQLAPMHYQQAAIIDAPNGYEFLDALPQRLSKRTGARTNDWEEILRGAAFIEWQRELRYPQYDKSSGIALVILNNYSHSDGQERLDTLKKMQDMERVLRQKVA